MAKGKYTLAKKYLKAIEKQLKNEVEPDWLKELKKERKEHTNNDTNN